MAFNYDDGLNTDRDLVRFYIQDVTEDSGPKPDDGNFTDDEIDGLVSANGTWQRAVAAAFRVLAASWRRYPSFKADGLSLNRSDIAKGYDEAARDWEKKYGIIMPVKVAGIIRVDGYSDDVTSDDVNTSSEYGIEFEYTNPK